MKLSIEQRILNTLNNCYQILTIIFMLLQNILLNNQIVLLKQHENIKKFMKRL